MANIFKPHEYQTFGLIKMHNNLKFSITLNSKPSKLSLHSLLKNMSKIPILDQRKEAIFFKFCLTFKLPPF